MKIPVLQQEAEWLCFIKTLSPPPHPQPWTVITLAWPLKTWRGCKLSYFKEPKHDRGKNAELKANQWGGFNLGSAACITHSGSPFGQPHVDFLISPLSFFKDKGNTIWSCLH